MPALLLAACGSAPSQEAVLESGNSLTAQMQALAGQATISQQQALTDAEVYVPKWGQASAVTAAYVALTLRDGNGQVADSAQNARSGW